MLRKQLPVRSTDLQHTGRHAPTASLTSQLPARKAFHVALQLLAGSRGETARVAARHFPHGSAYFFLHCLKLSAGRRPQDPSFACRLRGHDLPQSNCQNRKEYAYTAKHNEKASFVGMKVCSESPAWLRCSTRAQTCPASTRLLHTGEMPSQTACTAKSYFDGSISTEFPKQCIRQTSCVKQAGALSRAHGQRPISVGAPTSRPMPACP